MAELRGELMLNEPMGRHCSWRTGGPVRQLYKPADSADLQAFLQQLPEEEPVLWIGLGSNLLVRDGGIPGVVIRLSAKGFGQAEAVSETRIRAGAAIPDAAAPANAHPAVFMNSRRFIGAPISDFQIS